MNRISSADVSVVVQGPIIHNEKLTFNCLKSIRENLPLAEIVLSTWKGSEVNGLCFDVLVECNDPGSITQKNGQLNNVNRQITTTIKGLEKASRYYAIKLRTDCVIEGIEFMDYFQENDLCDASEYRYFMHKIVTLSLYVRNPLKSGYLFHMSDTFLFGKKLDLISLFDIPQLSMAKNEMYIPEQYIWTSFLKKKGSNIDLYSLTSRWKWSVFFNRKNSKNNTLSLNAHCSRFAYSELSLIDNFTVIEPEKASIRLPQRFYNNDRGSVYSQSEWAALNYKYCYSPYSWLNRILLPIFRLIANYWYYRKLLPVIRKLII